MKYKLCFLSDKQFIKKPSRKQIFRNIQFECLLQELVRQGIPQHLRGISWQMLCGAHNSLEKTKYLDYLKTESACEKVSNEPDWSSQDILTPDVHVQAIHRDIARTYPEHDFFKKKDGVGQEALFNVMKAYSIHDREVGYCQGSAFIVGLLLMQVCNLWTVCIVLYSVYWILLWFYCLTCNWLLCTSVLLLYTFYIVLYYGCILCSVQYL